MLIKAQMVPMPITAAEKFKEAAFFYNAMINVRTNVLMFPYYLSAFLAALRSVTDYLARQAAEHDELRAWWQEVLDKMRNDSLLQYLKGKRDVNIHQEPVHVFFWHGPKFRTNTFKRTRTARSSSKRTASSGRARQTIGAKFA